MPKKGYPEIFSLEIEFIMIECIFSLQAGQMFQQSPGWGGSEWYSPGMGGAVPPGHGSAHPRSGPAQLTFDNAYNFHTGPSSHTVMASPGMSGEFNVASAMSAAAGHHPFSLQGHDARSAAVSRAPGHGASPGLMYETSYHSAPGQGLPYHVSMTAGAAASVTPDKSSLLQLSAAAPPPRSHTHSHTVSHHGQGNLQPGYPPRQAEISSRSCDKLSAVQQQTAAGNSCSDSPGYPGLTVTASPVTQDERVTSSSRSLLTKELPLLPPPPDYRAPPPLYPGPELTSLMAAPGALTTVLHSPNTNTQQTFLASSAAVKRTTGDSLESRVPGTKLTASGQTSSSNTDSALLSPLARITAAPHQTNTHEITNNNKLGQSDKTVTQIKYQHSFVSATQNKALSISTSNQNSSSSIVCSNIFYTDPVLASSNGMMPQIDGNVDIDFDPEDEEWIGAKKHQQLRTPGGSKKSRRPQNDGGDPENITLRTPKEVFKDVMDDEEFLSQLSDLQISDLTSREQNLHDVAPSCDCAQAGLRREDFKIMKNIFLTLYFS